MLTFRVTAATNITSDSIITQPLPLPFLILGPLLLFFYHSEGGIYQQPQGCWNPKYNQRGSMKGYSKIIQKEGRVVSTFLLLCSRSQMRSYLGHRKMLYWRSNRKLENYMSNNLGNNLNLFSLPRTRCYLRKPRPGVIYGNQEQSSCDEMTTIMPPIMILNPCCSNYSQCVIWFSLQSCCLKAAGLPSFQQSRA